MFFLRLSGRLIPAHLVGCLVEIGGHTNGYGKNLIFLQGGSLKDGNQIGVCGRPYGWVYPRIYLASEILPRQWVHPIHKVWGHRHKPGPPLACRQEVPVYPPRRIYSALPRAILPHQWITHIVGRGLDYAGIGDKLPPPASASPPRLSMIPLDS